MKTVIDRLKQEELVQSTMGEEDLLFSKDILTVCNKLEEATKLLFEAVDRYPVEQDPKLWTSRVRKWLENE